MSCEYRFFLEDIQKACEKVERFTKGMTQEHLFSNEERFDAVMRNLEIIGEAAKHIPDNVRQEYSEIEWRKICGFRDVAIHEYFGLDKEVIWDIITQKIPDLTIKINGMLKRLK